MYIVNTRFYLFFSLIAFIFGCGNQDDRRTITRFEEIPSDSSGVSFINKLVFDQGFNIYTYRNFYNGGGVGLGDFNNDGLIDIYLTANQGPNKLYINIGNFHFTDITDKAGVAGTKAWATGVSLADVNGDGWMDIYVCNSGDVKGDNKENELFINNGDLTFTERAKEYGVADRGFTTHAVFFDYDRDNDLDLYILNNSYQAIGSFNLRKNERPKRDPLGGDKLMRNDGGHFTDVSEQAGIYGSVIGFGLGATVGDINKDGWPDLYVSNDFFERDYLYLNNHDGTFKECLTEQIKSISGASMGADLADINNDSWPDIFVTEMLPVTNARLKTVTTFENWDRYQNGVQNDYYHQFTRNMLQLNNGNNSFSEVGRLTGMEATDWSWGALMFDMDNDGLKDVYVANGIYQDLTNQDYLQYVSNEEVVRSIVSNSQVDYRKLVELIPSNPVPDFAFHNQGDLSFVNKAEEWGLGSPNFSNGSAYGDLDNDGDLDLVINRVNETASVVRNQTNLLQPNNRYLKFELKGLGYNTNAVGTQIEIVHNEQHFYIENMPNRGFESSVDSRPNLGLGAIDTVDYVRVQWPDGNETVLNKVVTNQILTLFQKDGVADSNRKATSPSILFEKVASPAQFNHVESDFVDFDRDKLLYHMLSTEGPKVSRGDVNGDGRDDFFIGGAKNSPGAIFIQSSNGIFKQTNQELFEVDKVSEDLGSLFFDADNDHDLDLYVCSGSNEFSTSSNALADRLYINDGNGNFKKSSQSLPTTAFENTSTVKAADYDNDGDLDLFVGVRSHPFLYGIAMNGYILKNDGKSEFSDVTASVAPALKKIGLITDACWADIDGDADVDLIVVGEYMPVKVFVNEGGQLRDQTDLVGLNKTNGWWNRIKATDLDKDGDIDFVVANHGFNSRFKASAERPVTMFVNDFDKNGSIEQIICSFNGGKSYPIVLRHDLLTQIPSLKKKYLKYENYSDQTINDIFSKAEMEDVVELNVFELGTGIIINDGEGKFSFRRLPVEAQFSTMYAIEVLDYDEDGYVDILLGGNLYGVKPEVGKYDASYGVFLKGDGTGNFKSIPAKESGLIIDGEVRDLTMIKANGTNLLLVARNNNSILFFKTK
ncbi:MAG TPA: VCBS repeat-containing protein [Cyclobacteriaceae bacterium]|nr:VCBS repeat-containing protein [Cyclobacteriaceae bacterium]